IILALALSYLERLLPIDILIGVPGIRLGLANIISLFALYYMNLPTTFGILLVRCILSTLLFGVFTSFVFSITGGIFSILIMYFLRRQFASRVSLLGLSVAGAATHHVGQILAAMLIFQSISVASYLPFLLLLSIPIGLLTGFFSLLTFNRLEKIKLVNTTQKR
ncbi:MAG: Gx transporter family protein, partial [Oscillospiraceae bacterium]